MKPDGCRCEGEKHVSMMCFVTKLNDGPTIRQLLEGMGFTHGDEGVRSALLALSALSALRALRK